MIRSENLIPLTSGAYSARSTIANYQVCENLYPEMNPSDTDPDVPVTHYPREGKAPLSSPPDAGPGRGVFQLSNGKILAVVGQAVYYIDTAWVWHKLGTLLGALLTPVSIADNGTTAVLVDGSPRGYTITLADLTFANIYDPTGTFLGSRRADYADTFLAFSPPGTTEWIVTLSQQVAFNPLIEANKASAPDPIQTIAYNLRQMWLLGTQSTEIWYLTGGTPFPYSAWPNVFVPYGCCAPYSLAQADIDLFWLSANKQGEIIALKTEGYGVVAVSTRALEYEWSNYSTVADVIGGAYQLDGHTFVVFHFPTADKTWAYDLATKQWHRRTTIDENGVMHRDSVSFYASASAAAGYTPAIVGQDWKTGQIYKLDSKVYTDNGTDIVCRRTFPHIMADMKEITHVSFVADFETGGMINTGQPMAHDDFNKDFGPDFGPGALQQSTPTLSMRYSNNGGASFGNYRRKTLIGAGEYRSLMRWRGLGMARDRVYELTWAYNGPSALQGAYVEPLGHSA